MSIEYQYPKRLKRSESFLGIHFDFHADADCQEIGKNTTPEMIESIIRQVKPDYIQCDCKGHPGFSSYPTRVGYPAQGIVADALRIWRQVTAEHGVGLYMHYSGVWDAEAVKHHPDWARVDETGERDKNLTSTFGPYVDELLIPQLKELCDAYYVDGVWVDGECWATRHDYGEQVLGAFRKETGILDIPRMPGDPHFFEFSEFCREGFRRYLRHYVDELHQHNSGFQIASNWAYTSFMPEPVEIDVDFISGDYTPQNSVNSARLEGRCIARQGKPWDLMAWGFSKKIRSDSDTEPANCTKSARQLMREAAIVLALGGGFQAYFTQKRDGSVRLWEMQVMSEVAEFCRARQKFCHHAEAVPQIGLLYSSAAFYRKNTQLFAHWHDELVPMQGILQSLLESQYAVEILMEHHLLARMAEYPLIIIPEWEYLEANFKAALLDYVRDGGNLIVIGPKAAALFKEELQIAFTGELDGKATQWLEFYYHLGGLSRNPSQSVKLGDGVKPFGKLYPDNNPLGPYETAASITPFGKGKIAATYFNFGERYLHGATWVARDFLSGLVKELYPEPLVVVSGSHDVDVTINRIDGKLAINLVNTAGPHADRDIYAFDNIPPVGPLDMIIRSKSAPLKVTLEPGGLAIPFQYEDEEIKLVLPWLEIHEVIVVEF
jgi:hypothetical protein